MNSYTLPQFWELYDRLPADVRRRANKTYHLWRQNPHELGLQFKRVGRTRPVYSVRIGLDYRALGLREGSTITWYWIGKHDEYVRLLKHA